MKTFKLTKTTDPRCIEYYDKAFPNLSNEDREQLRRRWINKYSKKKR